MRPSRSRGRPAVADAVLELRARTTSPISSSVNHAPRWFEIVHGSVVHDLVRRAGNISVHVIAGEECACKAPGQEASGGSRQSAAAEPRLLCTWGPWPPVAVGALARCQQGPGVGLGGDRQHRSGVPDDHCRRGGASWASGRRLLASAASALCYNFFFTGALLHIQHRQARGTSWPSSIFTIVAGGRLQRCRAGPPASWSPRWDGPAPPSLSMPSAASSPVPARFDHVLWATAYQVASMLGVRVVLLLPRMARSP